MNMLEFEQMQRNKVREKYNYKCYFCSKSIKKDFRNSVHHICPRALNGGWELHNLICLCSSCHNKIENYNRRLLLKLIKLDLLDKIEKRSPSKTGLLRKVADYECIFKLKYKPNFKLFSTELDNLFKKEEISLDALNKINGLKGELINNLNFNHNLDMSHIEALQNQAKVNEAKISEFRKDRAFYKDNMEKLARGKCLKKAEHFYNEFDLASNCTKDDKLFKKIWNRYFKQKSVDSVPSEQKESK
jgi:hypothetical protein